MDFNARQYDPQIGRFLAVDPLADAEGQQVFSPYMAMGNAPESMVDPNGTFFTYASDALHKALDNLREENLKKIALYMEELGGLDLINGNMKVQERGAHLSALIAMHTAFKEQLDAMDGDKEVEFHLSNELPFDGAAGSTFFNFDEGRVQFNFGGDNPWIATLAHELRHGYGMFIGETSPSKGFGDPLYDIQDEKLGYFTGLLFTSHPEDAVNGVYDSQSWDAATGTGGKYQYIQGRSEQLTINTPLSVFRKYSDLTFLTNPPNAAPNMTVGDVMRAINDDAIRRGAKPRFLFGQYLKK